ncbi:MAG: hypothetical protein LBV74_00400 [Tannerella sp.]|jgi:hypothetical protein|nr:hypothetical protein [Tannerella sp.]
MSYFKLVFLGLGLLMFSGYQALVDGLAVANQDALPDDKSQIHELVRDVYEWIENQSVGLDFDPVTDSDGRCYVGVDMEKLYKRLEELRQSGFFAEGFLDNYRQITLDIDERLKSKEIEWLVGDLPPYGNDVSPWCNCQDSPDDYWQILTIQDLRIENNLATFSWTWGDGFEYKMKAIKENNEWKIYYMEGFDIDAFFHE